MDIVTNRQHESGTLRNPRWGQERRLEFIEFRLLWEGRINRSELVDFFGISVPQASLDIAKYNELAPTNLLYDRRLKTYQATSSFLPVLTPADSQNFLTQLWAVESGAMAPTISFIGWRPPCDVVKLPVRAISTQILLRVLWAIRDTSAIRIAYQSMHRSESSKRWIEPHAIAYDGSRWHVRAWCVENQEFRDFVISRISNVSDQRPGAIDSAGDARWHGKVTLIVVPRTDLAPAQHKAIEREYGMHGGRLCVSTRIALLHYLVRHMQLDRVRTDPNAPPIYWANRTDLRHLLLPNK